MDVASKTLEFTDDNFHTEVLASGIPVLVDFGAAWCAPCRAIAPTIDELAEEFDGKVKVGKVDVDVSPSVSTKYGIRSMPTLIIYRGGEVVDQIIGRVPKGELVKRLEQQIAR